MVPSLIVFRKAAETDFFVAGIALWFIWRLVVFADGLWWDQDEGSVIPLVLLHLCQFHPLWYPSGLVVEVGSGVNSFQTGWFQLVVERHRTTSILHIMVLPPGCLTSTWSQWKSLESVSWIYGWYPVIYLQPQVRQDKWSKCHPSVIPWMELVYNPGVLLNLKFLLE